MFKSVIGSNLFFLAVFSAVSPTDHVAAKSSSDVGHTRHSGHSFGDRGEFPPEITEAEFDGMMPTALLSEKKIEPPQYMLDVYQQLAELPTATESKQDFQHMQDMDRHQQDTFGVGNTVKGYRMTKGKAKHHQKLLELNFKVGPINDDDVTAAEIVIIRNTSSNLWSEHDDLSLLFKEHRVGEVVYSTQRMSKYDVFEVSEDFRNWLRKRGGKNAVYKVQLQLPQEDGSDSPPAQSSSKLFDFTLAFQDDPLVVVYTGLKPQDTLSSNTTRQGDASGHSVIKRQTERKRGMANKALLSDDCRLYPLQVNFKEINWNNVLLPDSYDAGYCRGKCPRGVLNSHFNATRHTWIINRLRDSGHSSLRVPRIRCVPITYDPLVVLYMNYDSVTTVDRWEDMKVTQCGCR